MTENVASAPAQRKPLTPTPGRTALLVIDMQNAFCHEEGSFARFGFDVSMLKAAIEPCARLVAAARRAKIPVIFTRILYRADYSDGGLTISHMMPEMVAAKSLAAGTWDVELVDEFKPAAGEYVIDKNRFSAFYAPELERILRERGIDSLVVCGVTTNCCVESTVRDAYQRNYKVVVAQDAVGEMEKLRHEVSLRSMRFLVADLATADEAIRMWD